jgi:Uma2 family endonuclease
MPIRTESGIKLTYEDYCLIPEDGRRHEIIDGEHFVSAAPVPYHQTLSRRIQFQLYTQVEEQGLGEIYDAPIDVEMSRTDIVQPDLAVILNRSKHLVTRVRIQGAPDLVVEILSESTSRLDRGKKKERYARAGVPEYWVVDGGARIVQQFVLAEQEYELAGEHGERVSFLALPGVCVDLTKVW